jgi:hypothetical protein
VQLAKTKEPHQIHSVNSWTRVGAGAWLREDEERHCRETMPPTSMVSIKPFNKSLAHERNARPLSCSRFALTSHVRAQRPCLPVQSRASVIRSAADCRHHRPQPCVRSQLCTAGQELRTVVSMQLANDWCCMPLRNPWRCSPADNLPHVRGNESHFHVKHGVRSSSRVLYRLPGRVEHHVSD